MEKQHNFHCPRVPKSDSFILGQNSAYWKTNELSIDICSDCGNISPFSLIELVNKYIADELELRIIETDKDYKFYIEAGVFQGKYYKQHFDIEDERIREEARIAIEKLVEKQTTKTMENTELTFGQKAVGLRFNHATGDLHNDVEKAKLLSAELIDLVEKHTKEIQNDKGVEGYTTLLTRETNIFRTQAFNKVIEAQMAVVKFLTWEN